MSDTADAWQFRWWTGISRVSHPRITVAGMEALPVPKVSMRELTRATARVMKQVHQDSRPVVITHHGKPVALLSPIAAANGIVAILDGPKPSREPAVEILEGLSDVEKEVLAAFPSGGQMTSAGSIEAGSELSTNEILRTLTTLELRGLVKKRFWGYVRL